MSEQRVTKRKTHTKSRKGCHQCKQRHTKCNEARPRCANCVRLDISCTWPELTNGHSASPTTSPSAHTSPHEEGQTRTPANAFELSLPDMRLLHHWTTKGYIALHPSLATRHDVWQTPIIELGFDHTFLLHGILALSAVHKASFLLPIERQGLLVQADAHISQALDSMRKHLETSSEHTAIPMFVLSAVLLTYNFGSVQEKPDDPVGSLHHCFMLMHGIKVVIGPHWDKIQLSPIIGPMIEMTSVAIFEALSELAKDDEYPEILRLIELTELMLDSQDKAVCATAITELHRMAVCIVHIKPGYDAHQFLFPWAARLSNRFFDLLASHNLWHVLSRFTLPHCWPRFDQFGGFQVAQMAPHCYRAVAGCDTRFAGMAGLATENHQFCLLECYWDGRAHLMILVARLPAPVLAETYFTMRLDISEQ